MPNQFSAAVNTGGETGNLHHYPKTFNQQTLVHSTPYSSLNHYSLHMSERETRRDPLRPVTCSNYMATPAGDQLRDPMLPLGLHHADPLGRHHL